MNPLDLFRQSLAAFGWQGLLVALVILVTVYVAKKSGIVATGSHARLANIVLSAILYGLSDNPASEKALLATFASILAGLAYEGLQYIGKKLITP